jgi:2'-5' RNA ligase
MNKKIKSRFEYYSLIIYPEIPKEEINKFRKEYDPLFKIIDFHITLIFPIKVPIEIKEESLTKHIKSVVDRWKSFKINIKELELAWDNWLFLLIKKGNEKIINLHDELYRRELEPYLRKDIKFIPHVSIGSFTIKEEKYDLRNPEKLTLDKDKYEKAIKLAKEIDLGYECKINKLTLVKLNDKLENCKMVKNFNLKE